MDNKRVLIKGVFVLGTAYALLNSCIAVITEQVILLFV